MCVKHLSSAWEYPEKTRGMRHHPEGAQTLHCEILLCPDIPHSAVVFRGQRKFRFFFAKVEERERVGTVGERFYVELRVLAQCVLLIVCAVFIGTVSTDPERDLVYGQHLIVHEQILFKRSQPVEIAGELDRGGEYGADREM